MDVNLGDIICGALVIMALFAGLLWVAIQLDSIFNGID